MTVAQLLSHPLFIAFMVVSMSTIGAVVTFLVRYILVRAITGLRADMKQHRDETNKMAVDVARMQVELDNQQRDQRRLDKDVRSIADSVNKMLAALPANYSTRDDVARLEDGLYKRLDDIADSLGQKPDRAELDRKADRSELDNLRAQIQGASK